MEKAALEIAALRFLRTGRCQNISAPELATACDAAIQEVSRTSLTRALSLSKRFVKHARTQGGIVELTAFRSLARASHMAGKHRDALAAYLQARKRLSGDPAVRARIDRALVDVYMYLGNFRKSRIHAQAAIRTFNRLELWSDLAQTRVNYANLLHRQDRHREAEQVYRVAAEFFEQADNRLALARTNYNRANSLVQLFRMDEADKLYRQALATWEKEGFDLDANDTRYGMAWLHMLTGRFHAALLELAECERVYQAGGDPRGAALCSLDRAEVFLSLGLYTDALESARTSQGRFERLGMRYEQAKAALFRGRAAAAMERHTEAHTALGRALGGFTADRNDGFVGACYLLAGELSAQEPESLAAHLKQARAHFTRAQLPLWEAMCDLRAVQANGSLAARKRLDKNAAVRSVPQLFAAWQTMRGDWEYSRGDLAVARRCWQRAADRLDAVRAGLPPVELRSTFGRNQQSPHTRLIEAELEDDPAMASVWSERYKTAGKWMPLTAGLDRERSRRRVNESLDELAHQVAVLSQRIETGTGERSVSRAASTRRLAYLQNRVRTQLLELERSPGHAAINNNRLRQQMRVVSLQLPVIQFHLRENDIVAFVHKAGDISVSRIPDGRRRLAAAMQRWRFVLEGQLLAGQWSNAEDKTLEDSLWSDLGSWLWAPLRIEPTTKTVLLIPEGELANLPWKALQVDGRPLVEFHDFVIAPSFRHFQAAQRLKVTSDALRVFRGQADDLPQVDKELEALVSFLGNDMQVFRPARRADWPEEGSAALWHFAGHANLRADNPFYSYLVLADGALFATDFRLKKCRVNLVTLAACRSGEQVALPGEESTGLVRSLLEMGARNVIAGHWPVSDETTALWMTAFYDKYLRGTSLQESIKHAALTVRSLHPSAYHWAAFSVFGAGD